MFYTNYISIMTKINKFIFIITLIFGLNFAFFVSAAPYYYDVTDYTTTNTNEAIDTDVSPWIDISDPLRDWAGLLLENGWVNAILNKTKITTHNDAEKQTLNLIRNWVNYALSLLGFVALIYLLYHGFLILTAAGDDEQYKKWMKWLRIAATAIAWIWLSWLFVSLIYRLINWFFYWF